MKIGFHGGKCCGIKTIHGLGYNPNELIAALPKRKEFDKPADQYGRDFRSVTNFFRDKAPCETCLARLDRYIKYLDEKRPKGIIEIALADFNGNREATSWNQIRKWEPILLERGFKLVNECMNSNSGNKVYVYHRNSGE